MSYANQYQIIFSGVDEKVRPEKGEGFLLCKKEVITEAFKRLDCPSPLIETHEQDYKEKDT